LFRASNKLLIPVPDPDVIPVEYQYTLTGREMLARDENAVVNQHKFLRHNANGLQIYMSQRDIECLHQSEYWVADGTFEMRPPMFAQIYTIHAFVNGEGNIL